MMNQHTAHACLFQKTYIFTSEADPQRRACTAHMHSEEGLQECVGHAGQVHVTLPAFLPRLIPGEVLVEQQEGVIVHMDGLQSEVGLLWLIWCDEGAKWPS